MIYKWDNGIINKYISIVLFNDSTYSFQKTLLMLYCNLTMIDKLQFIYFYNPNKAQDD